MNGKILFVSLLIMGIFLSSVSFAFSDIEIVIDGRAQCCGHPYGPVYPYPCDLYCSNICFICGDLTGFGYNCAGEYGYGYSCIPHDDNDKPRMDKLSVDVESSCDENLVTVTDGDGPVNNAKVSVQVVDNGPLDSGYTDSNGEFDFQGCDMKVSVYVNKDGYFPTTVEEGLVSCSSCEEGGEEPPPEEPPTAPPPEEPQPETPPPTAPQRECTTDADCAVTHYCTAAFECMPVTGCGLVEDHALVPYECGDGPDCPSCKEGYTCVDNKCVQDEIEGEDGFVGENSTVTVFCGGKPCANRDLQGTDPNGKSFTGKTDENGQFQLPLSFEGQYKIALVDENGEVSAETILNALPMPQPTEPEKKPDTTDNTLPTLLFILLLLLLGVVLYLRGRGGPKKK